MNQKWVIKIILVIIIVAFIAISVYFLLARKPLTNNPPTTPVTTEIKTSLPTSIIEKSNQVIISQVGNNFFKKYISLNQSNSKYYQVDDYCLKNPDSCSKYLQKSYYLMVYSLKIPEKPFVNEVIEFTVDDEGNLINEREIYGIPNCLREPIECDFPIDETEAIIIAQGAGLEKGIKNWKTSFNWNAGDSKTYIWTVQNTLSEDKQVGSSGGKVVVIDANTGKVIEINGWSAIP